MTQPKAASKFTPGPWSRIRAYEDKPQLFDLVGGHPATTIIARDVHSSNVRLIAKAPEMYELLEMILKKHPKLPTSELLYFLEGWVHTISEEARRIKAAIDGIAEHGEG